MFNNKFKKLLLASSILVATGAANAGYELKLSDEDKLTFGGYIKVDARYVDGDVGYKDFFLGKAFHSAENQSKSQINLNAKETRFNMKYNHGKVMGYIELDFINSAQGNEIISNSVSPRLRHAFIKYEDLVVGQTWTTFMNTSAIPETVDFAGPANGLAFIRQGQVRYTMGNFQVSLENPESWGGDTSFDDVPDLVGKYNFKGDWGNVSVAALARRLHTVTGENESALGYSVAGRVKTVGKDDVRFQVHGGNVGRYVGVVSAHDIVGEKAEDTTAYLAAYRHFWADDLRSTVAYGHAKADLDGWETTQWSVNVFKDLTKQLSVGVEVGNYKIDSDNVDSNFAQATLKYVL